MLYIIQNNKGAQHLYTFDIQICIHLLYTTCIHLRGSLFTIIYIYLLGALKLAQRAVAVVEAHDAGLAVS